MPDSGDKTATAQAAVPRAVAAISTNAEPALRPDQKSVPGPYVVAEFAHDADLSLPTTDSDRVTLTQDGPVRSTAGATYRRRGTNDASQGGGARAAR